MSRHLAKLICLAASGIAGYAVFLSMAEVFEGWTPRVGGAVTLVIVITLLYFPLARPIADLISDRLAVMTHRGRHIRTGSGLDDIPDAPVAPPCSLCGAPLGPICKACDEKMRAGGK